MLLREVELKSGRQAAALRNVTLGTVASFRYRSMERNLVDNLFSAAKQLRIRSNNITETKKEHNELCQLGSLCPVPVRVSFRQFWTFWRFTFFC